MPEDVIYEDQRLPASYANFYIANESVIVPTFRCSRDQKALDIIAGCFPGRRVVGIDSTEIIWGLGTGGLIPLHRSDRIQHPPEGNLPERFLRRMACWAKKEESGISCLLLKQLLADEILAVTVITP